MSTTPAAAVALTESIDLDVGIVVGGVCHHRAVIRVARLSDIYTGASAVAVPEDLQDNPGRRIAYQMAIDDAQVLAQVVKLGNLDPAPSIEVLIAELDPDDMSLLRAGAQRLKKKLQKSRGSLPITGVPNISSSGPDSD